jgi:hypothetical protein
MKLYSHLSGIKNDGRFSSHEQLSKIFLIDLEDCLIHFITNHYIYNVEDEFWSFTNDCENILRLIYRYIFEKPSHEIELIGNYNNLNKVKLDLIKMIRNNNGIEIFDLISILITNNDLCKRISIIFDSFCITHRINVSNQTIEPRLSENENAVFQQAKTILGDPKKSSANKYFEEALESYQAGKHKDATEKLLKSLETEIKSLLDSNKSLGDLITPLINKLGNESELCISHLHKFWGTASNLIRHGSVEHSTHNFTAEETRFILVYVSNLITYINHRNNVN